MSWFHALRKSAIVRKINEFQTTSYHLVMLALVALVSNILGLDILAFTIYAIIAAYTFVFNKDSLGFVPVMLYIIFCVSIKNSPKYSDYYSQPYNLTWMIILGGIMIASLIFHLTYYQKWARVFTIRRLTTGLIVFCITLFTNGLFYIDYTFQNLASVFSISASYFFVYIILTSTIVWSGDSFDFLARTCFVAGLVISIQLYLTYFLNTPFIESNFAKGQLHNGWAMSNHIGAALYLGLPMAFWLMTKRKNSWLYFIGATGMLFACVFTKSRGSLLMVAPVYVAGVIYACVKGINRKLNLIMASGTLVVVVLVAVVKWDEVLKILSFFIENGLNDRGRFELWSEGISAFAEHFWFGVGIRYKYEQYFYSFTFFHNSLIQYAAAGGIFGIFTYWLHRCQTLTLFTHNFSEKRLFLGVAILGILAISLLDNPMMYPYTIFYYMTYLVFAERDEYESGYFHTPLFSLKHKRNSPLR